MIEPVELATVHGVCLQTKKFLAGKHIVDSLTQQLEKLAVTHGLRTLSSTHAIRSSALAATLTIEKHQSLWQVANKRRISEQPQKPGFRGWRDSLRTSIQARQPLTRAHCFLQNQTRMVVAKQENVTLQIFDPIPFSWTWKGKVTDNFVFSRNRTHWGNLSVTLGISKWLEEVTGNSSHPGIQWDHATITNPRRSFDPSNFLVALVAIPLRNSTALYACSIDARWANSIITFGIADQVGSKLGNSAFTEAIRSGTLFATYLPQIKGAGHARLTNQDTYKAIENVLGVMVTEALSHTSSMSSILGTLKEIEQPEGIANTPIWIDEMLPARWQYVYKGGTAFNYSFNAGDNATKFVAKVQIKGYGYGPTSATAVASVVLVMYILIAISFMFFSIGFQRTTSGSWDSILELVALAMNSQPSAILDNTGAGIGCLDTLKQPVKIRVADDRLQLVFGTGEGSRVVRRLVPNHLYGDLFPRLPHPTTSFYECNTAP
ncbi:hypothetical protein VTL71DRAFT_4329 [Oculimacula yallundae]|uniref:Uncharacterized protein n=1 Tax=Oculimacula yallundae TaxID=86028 RepID=A0ABR4C297_9HELO